MVSFFFQLLVISFRNLKMIGIISNIINLVFSDFQISDWQICQCNLFNRINSNRLSSRTDSKKLLDFISRDLSKPFLFRYASNKILWRLSFKLTRRSSVLCRLPDIKIAWINPWYPVKTFPNDMKQDKQFASRKAVSMSCHTSGIIKLLSLKKG